MSSWEKLSKEEKKKLWVEHFQDTAIEARFLGYSAESLISALNEALALYEEISKPSLYDWGWTV